MCCAEAPARYCVANGRVYPIGPVIEGYSVDEAASVLGVPKGRVWELLARGILAGTPEDGGGMRVYLQGRPMEPIVGKPPQSRQSEPDERPPRTNGNRGEHGQPGFEASPFRELLTEFRNLTERYGQALLALGEARGEVASLRTRVELLEARVDLRLPSSAPFVQWAPRPPGPEADESEPVADATDMEATAAVVPDTIEAEPEPLEAVVEVPPAPEAGAQAAPAAPRSPKRGSSRPRSRRQGARSATKGFVDALARAQDPTISPLPGGDAAQTAFNELRERIRRESLGAEARESTEATEARESTGATEAIEAEAADSIDVGEAAPAEAVELDPLLADEELGGAMQEAPITSMEAVAAEEPASSSLAETSDQVEAVAQVEQLEEGEPVPVQQFVESEEPVAHEEPVELVEPPASAPPAEPETAAEAIEAAEPVAPTYSHEWDEPDWIAEEDIDWGTEQPQAQLEAVALGESPEVGWSELPRAEGEAHHEAEGQAVEAEVEALDEAEEEAVEAEAQPMVSGAEAHDEAELHPVEAVKETREGEEGAPLDAEPLRGDEEIREEPQPSEADKEPYAEPESLRMEDETREEPQALAAELKTRVEAEPLPLDADKEIQAGSESLGVAEERREGPRPPEVQEAGAASKSSGAQIDAEPARPPVLGSTTPHAIEVEAPRSATGFGGTVPEASSSVKSEPQGQDPGQPAGSEEELMWLGDEFQAGPAAWSTPGRATTIPKPAATEAMVSAAEDEALARLAVERGWDDAELHAIRSLLAQPGRVVLDESESEAQTTPVADDEARSEETRDEEALDWEQGPSAWNPPPLAHESRNLPGAVELDQAMAAFEVSAWSKEAISHQTDEPRRTEPDDPQPASQRSESSAFREEPEPSRPSAQPPEPREETDADWLRGRRGPAANAYRRLRRLFP